MVIEWYPLLPSLPLASAETPFQALLFYMYFHISYMLNSRIQHGFGVLADTQALKKLYEGLLQHILFLQNKTAQLCYSFKIIY